MYHEYEDCENNSLQVNCKEVIIITGSGVEFLKGL